MDLGSKGIHFIRNEYFDGKVEEMTKKFRMGVQFHITCLYKRLLSLNQQRSTNFLQNNTLLYYHWRCPDYHFPHRYQLKDAVVEGVVPFYKVHGVNICISVSWQGTQVQSAQASG